MEAVKREAEAIVDATYHAYLNTALGELEEALEDGVDILESMGLYVESIEGGSAGYDSCVHSEEHDVGNGGNMFLWRTYDVAQIDINGMSFTLTLEEPEEDDEDDQESEGPVRCLAGPGNGEQGSPALLRLPTLRSQHSDADAPCGGCVELVRHLPIL